MNQSNWFSRHNFAKSVKPHQASPAIFEKFITKEIDNFFFTAAIFEL